MLTLCFLIVIITIVPILLREQIGEKFFPFSNGNASVESKKLQMTDWASILKILYKVFKLKNSILVIVVLFITMGAYNFFETLLPVFAVKITGWTNVKYSQVFATADLVGGIAGMLAGGLLIEKFGKKKMVNIYFFLIIGMALALSCITSLWHNNDFLKGFVISYRTLNAFAKIGVFSIAMQCCSKNISASQFTIFMTMGAMGSIAGAFFIGLVKENYDWSTTFIFFTIFIGVAWLVLQFINIEKHVTKINSIEFELAKSKPFLIS